MPYISLKKEAWHKEGIEALNNLSHKSYGISYRFNFPPEDLLSGKQTFPTYEQSQVGSNGITWDAAWKNETD